MTEKNPETEAVLQYCVDQAKASEKKPEEIAVVFGQTRGVPAVFVITRDVCTETFKLDPLRPIRAGFLEIIICSENNSVLLEVPVNEYGWK